MEEAKRLHDLIRKELRGCMYPRVSILEPLYAEVVELVGEEGAPTWAVLRSSGLLESLVVTRYRLRRVVVVDSILRL